MEEYMKWLENKIEVCLEDKDLQREHWAFCQALKKYRELALAIPSGWVSCENALPENEGEYLTYNKANDSQTVQYFDGRVWGHLATVKPDVTHWTKLPPAPACS
jgi:hypothetical protein